MTHDVLYRKIGLRKLNQFIDPIIIYDTEMVFPKNSELIWFRANDIASSPNSNLGYLNNTKKPAIITKFNYVEPIGNFKSKNGAVKQLITKFKKMNSDMKYIPTNARSIKLSKNVLLIHSYGVINAVHKYMPNQMSSYHKWYNAFKTMTSTFKELSYNDRHTYILIELPANIPDRTKFDKYVDKTTHMMFDDFPTSKHLTLLELWKFLTPSLIKESLMNEAKNSMLGNLTFMFSYNNKIALLNVGKLLASIKEYDVKDTIQEVPAKTLRKLFLIYLKKIVVNGAMTIGEVDQKDNLTISGIDEDDNYEDIEEVNVDEILENDFDEKEDIDYDKISDDLMGNDLAKDLIDEVEGEFTSINELKKEEVDQVSKLEKQLRVLKDNKIITKKENDTLMDALEYQSKAKSPYDGKVTLKEMLTINEEDLEIPEDKGIIPDINIIDDKETLKDPIKAMDEHYLEKIYRKDMIRTIYSMQNADVVIKNHTVDLDTSILGDIETHTLEIKPLGGKPSKIVIKIPVVDKTGELRISGNSYKLRKQRVDIPIRKIDFGRVAITSYFGKSFITKSDMKKDDIGFWFRKKLISAADKNKSIKNVVLMPVKLMDVILPNLYVDIARYVKMFRIGKIKYSFDYKNRRELVKNIKTKLSVMEENNKYVVVGSTGYGYILMDFNNKLYEKKGSKLIELPSIFEQLNIDVTSMPMETVHIKIFKKRLPIALLLSYYLGFNNLVKLLKAKHTVLERNKRYSLEDNEYAITFKDKKVILDKNDKLASLILGGLTSLNKSLKDIELILLNKKESFPVLFNKLELSPLYVNEIKLMEDLFVDPMTKSVLELMKEPVTFKGLLIRSAELLLDNNYRNPKDASGMIIKGYERIPGMIYTEMISSLRTYENKNTFSKSKITMDPYAVWRTINNDSTTMLVEDLNPIASLKQSEDTTALGNGGFM